MHNKEVHTKYVHIWYVLYHGHYKEMHNREVHAKYFHIWYALLCYGHYTENYNNIF